MRFGEVAFVDGDAEAGAGVDVEKRTPDRDVAERVDQGNRQVLTADLDGDAIAEHPAQCLEDRGVDVGDEVAVGAVGGDDFAAERVAVDLGGVEVEANGLIDRRADVRPGLAARQVGGDRGEDVAAVEGRGAAAGAHPAGVGDLTRAVEAVALGDERDEAVVGDDEELPALRARNQWLSRAAHARIDDADEDRVGRIVGRRVGQEARSVGHGERGHLVRQVDHADGRIDLQHDALADGDGIVARAEVRQEDDGRRTAGAHRRREKQNRRRKPSHAVF